MNSNSSRGNTPITELRQSQVTTALRLPRQVTADTRLIAAPESAPVVPVNAATTERSSTYRDLVSPAFSEVQFLEPGLFDISAFGTPRTATAPAVVRRRFLHRPRLLLVVQVLTILTVGLAVAALVQAEIVVTLGVLVLSLITKYHTGQATIRPGLPHLGRIVSDMALPFAAVALGVGFAGLGGESIRDAAAIVAAVNLVDVSATLLRRQLEAPVRVVVVGDDAAVATAAARWAGHAHVKVVGGLLVGADAAWPLSETFGVRTIRGIDEVMEWVQFWAADLVVVSPGSTVTSEDLRQLSWLLEGSDAGLAVTGVLDSIAPHRIDSASLAGATLIHTRSSRPSTYIRTAKWCFDRVVGSLLLLVASPLLAVFCVAVRLESKGPAIFKQVRVGKDGREFTIFKMRTMRQDAEALKESLADSDEGNGVLFKMHADPRITRVGSLLRKSSMDELPQLINVVRGEMSLVGPRPALPHEVELYSDVVRRRLAVRPGMTGLWQVSGRSDLSWEESVELDLHYTDNYRLSDDLLIGLRTVGAVAKAKGAY